MAGDWAAEINGDQDDDEALRIAIAMSLGRDPGEQAGRRSTARVIDLTREDDDSSSTDSGDDVESVEVVSDAGGSKHAGHVSPTAAEQQQQPPPPPPGLASSTPTSQSVLGGLDRKKMEEERLARLSKRKASQLEDAPPPSRPAQRLRTEHAPPPLPPTAAATAVKKRTGQPAEPQAVLPSSSASAPRSAHNLPFPRGVVKKTWAYGQPRQGDDIKIEEVLQKQHLELAVLSSFQWDEDWLLSKIDLARTRLVLIAYAADERQREEMRSNVPRDRIRFCFPPMQPIGSMHSKLQLLKYDKYMRIVVPTGNLMSFDWGETGALENMVFIIDLPKFQSAEERDAQDLTPFAEDLMYFLRAQGLDEKLIASLHNYDFTQTGRYQFVHTIPGSHITEEAWKKTGYCGLGRAVGNLGLCSSNAIELDVVCASLGAVNYSLVSALYHACQGDSGLKEYEGRASTGKGKSSATSDATVSTAKRHMRIFFPSRDTVVQSKGGKDGAGTICFQAKWWQAATFPRELLRDCKSVRPGLLMHSKVMYVRPSDDAPNAPGRRGFAYVGSANLSESAWGRLVRDRASGKPRMTCRNWECGVLVKMDDAEDGIGNTNAARVARDDGDDDGGGTLSGGGELQQVFGGRVPVPMEWPGQEYSGESRTPWFNREG